MAERVEAVGAAFGNPPGSSTDFVRTADAPVRILTTRPIHSPVRRTRPFRPCPNSTRKIEWQYRDINARKFNRSRVHPVFFEWRRARCGKLKAGGLPPRGGMAPDETPLRCPVPRSWAGGLRRSFRVGGLTAGRASRNRMLTVGGQPVYRAGSRNHELRDASLRCQGALRNQREV